jgi:hypothetical protein
MNDSLMVGIVLTLVFGAIIFYLYNRLTMTERKMGLFEGVLTDLKIMMDAAPYSMSAESNMMNHMHEFEPSPEYLNAISGPIPLKADEVEEVSDDDYKRAMDSPSASQDVPYKSLQIDELAGVPVTATNAISVTKLSPDLESMSLKELQALAKEKGLVVVAGARRKTIIDLLKGDVNLTPTVTPSSTSLQGTMLDGPELKGGASLE